MQAFMDRQLAFDSYLPGTPHEAGDLADLFPYHIWGRGNMPPSFGKEQREQQAQRRAEAVRRRRSPSCVEEACAYGNLPHLVLLYAQGKFDVLTRRGMYEGSDASPLMWAAFKGHLHIVKFLVAAAMKECQQLGPTDAATAEEGEGADPRQAMTHANGTQRGQCSREAVYDRQQQAFDAFINCASSLGHTALQWAIISGQVPIVRFLLDHNADPFHRDRQGFDAAFAAVQNDQLAILFMLLEDSIAAKAITLVDKHRHATAEGTNEENRFSKGAAGAHEYAVGIAATGDDDLSGDSAAIEDGSMVYVVDMEKIKKVLNDTNRPPPSTFTTTGSPEAAAAAFVVRRTNHFFLDPTLRDVEGHNLLHWAAYRNSPAACQYLVLRWRYDVNVPDVHGRTPIIWAAREGFSEVLEFLCLHGGNRLLCDKDGINAVQYALMRNHPEAHYVLTQAPEVDLTRAEESGLLEDAAMLKKVAAYTSIRERRAFGTVKMILTHGFFAVQFVLGACYMFFAYVVLAVAPSMFSYFPYGVYFFKNMLWTTFVRHPVQNSKSEKRDIGREYGLPFTLAESVRGTWRYRLREPANLICVFLMMCLQMFCWTQLGLTPFVHSFFSFNFLFRPLRELATSAVSLGQSPLASTVTPPGTSACEAAGAAAAALDAKAHAACLTSRLSAFIAAHDAQFKQSHGGTSHSIVGSGVNIMSEVRDATSLLMLSDPAAAPGASQSLQEQFLTPAQLFSSAHYVGGAGPLGWCFGGDAIRMVAVMLPLLFTATIALFVATKMRATASTMRFRPVHETIRQKEKEKKQQTRRAATATATAAAVRQGPYQCEGILATSPLWRILRSRQYGWLHPRAMMLERHTQLPARACYCPEQDVMVHRYDSYSILLDCPIGAHNHLLFVLGVTCFVLFECLLFFWGVHQMNFFHGLLSNVECQHEHWMSGLFDGLASAANAKAALALRSAAVLSEPRQVAHCLPHGGHQSVVNWDWLNSFLSLFFHGLPRKQNFYINNSLLPGFLANPSSLLQRLKFIVCYYWWPTRAGMFATFLFHFAFLSLAMGAAIAVRQWSAVWRGATRMELSNPLTPCHSYGGRLIATFPLSSLYSVSARLRRQRDESPFVFEIADYDDMRRHCISDDSSSGGGGGVDRFGHSDKDRSRRSGAAGGGGGGGVDAGGTAAASGVDGAARAQLCNVNLDEEYYYEQTDPAKARIVNAEGLGLFDKSIYAESSWALVNALLFLVGRAGRKWDGAMAVSASLQPVKVPMLSEFL